MGYRVLKTSIAVVAAIYLSQLLGLSSPVSAGLLAILGIEVTKRKGIRNALQRIAASILGLLFASALFHLFGFHVWVIGLFVLVVFPILNRMKLGEGAVSGSVVMFHLFNSQSVDLQLIFNEIQLLVVGLGTATLINIAYMPKADKEIERCKQETERLFSEIFRNIARHLRDHSAIWDGKELLEARKTVERGTELASRSLDNTLFFGTQTYWRVYFYMRSEQLESIYRMVNLVAQIYEVLPQGEFMASLFEELADDLKEMYYTGRTEEKMYSLEQLYKQMPLPATRAEFEIRSAMLQLHRELAYYLSVAKEQKKQKPGQE